MKHFKTTFDYMRNTIAAHDLEKYRIKAQNEHRISLDDAEKAIAEYRHHMYLIWCNNDMSGDHGIVPSIRADMIWHIHLQDNGNYNNFCLQVFGEIIIHNSDDFPEESEALRNAVNHTKMIHAERKNLGFVSRDYLPENDRVRSATVNYSNYTKGCASPCGSPC